MFDECLKASQKNRAINSDGVKHALKEYSEHQIKNWKNSKKIVVYQSQSQLQNFINDARAHKNLNKKMYFGIINDNTADFILNKTGVDVHNYNAVSRADSILKLFDSHGNEINEAQRGQRAINDQDILMLPQLFGEIDFAEHKGKYTKMQGNNDFINVRSSVEPSITIGLVVQNKQLDIRVQTMYATKKGSNAAAVNTENNQPLPVTPKTDNGNASFNNSISKSNENVKFSLKENVEQTKDLIAVHNISEEKLMKSLQLGGLPMPSIAVMKAKEAKGNSVYGNISLVFPKSTIDPSLNTDNKIYGGDAWTPVYPTVEYKINEDTANEIYSRAREATKNAYAYKLNSVSFHPSNLEDTLNRLKGESGLIDYYKNDYGMKQLYLAKTGEPVKAVKVKETRTELSDGQVEMYDYLIENFGDTLSILDNGTYPARKWVQEHGDEFDNVRREYYRYKTPDITEEQLDNIFNNLNEKPIDKVRLARQINRYRRNGRATVETKEDYEATQKEIYSRINQNEYNKWLNDLFFGIEEKKGIRNNIDPYTSSGNLRSFEQLHYEETLENVVKQMRTQNIGDIAWFSGLGIWGVAAKNYGTLEQVKSDSFRLQNLPEDEFIKIKRGFGERLDEIAESLENKYKADNPFIDNENKMTNIIDALRESKTKSGVLKYLKQYFKNASESTVDDLLDLIADIGNMPVDYFEAKPQRAVGFNEVYTAVIPDNSSEELVNALNEAGVNYETYEEGNEKARLDVLNSLDDVKFSRKEQSENQVVDVDEFSQEDYNYPKLSRAEYKRLYSEIMRWHANHTNRIIEHRLDNGYKYLCSLDDDYNLTILGKYKSINIHERRNFVNEYKRNRKENVNDVGRYDNGRSADGQLIRNSMFSTENGKATADNDELVRGEISSEGRNNGAGYSEIGNNDYSGKEKYSLKEQPIDYNSLLEENEELPEMNEDLQRMLKLTSVQNEKLNKKCRLINNLSVGILF